MNQNKNIVKQIESSKIESDEGKQLSKDEKKTNKLKRVSTC